jgi:hypothetical protein
MAGEGINRLARLLDGRMKDHDIKPPLLDFGTIQDDMSLLTNNFPLPIPYTDYVICRSVCYDPEIPLTMSWWKDEGWKQDNMDENIWYSDTQTENEIDWSQDDDIKTFSTPEGEQKNQPQKWIKDKWGCIVDPDTNESLWDEKHEDHNHGTKGEHDHGEDEDGKHYHDIYLPRKMYRIQPGDRVLVAWVGDDAVVIDIIMSATEMM